MANKITGNEQVYVVKYTYTKRYINSFDLLHKITPSEEVFTESDGIFYAVANSVNV